MNKLETYQNAKLSAAAQAAAIVQNTARELKGLEDAMEYNEGGVRILPSQVLGRLYVELVSDDRQVETVAVNQELAQHLIKALVFVFGEEILPGKSQDVVDVQQVELGK